ncbi:hypothetical protein [Sinorhizobium meliloti]|uniref:hypothetical protein n=1 Tax=Rhizobium meliloti TaxID=382 RepID=UPI0012687F9C|nr:hypothetical protein [Sinorhizobium meliloti]
MSRSVQDLAMMMIDHLRAHRGGEANAILDHIDAWQRRGYGGSQITMARMRLGRNGLDERWQRCPTPPPEMRKPIHLQCLRAKSKRLRTAELGVALSFVAPSSCLASASRQTRLSSLVYAGILR